MPVTSVEKDPGAMTLTVTAQFGAPVARVWQMWEDPRLLERWWGPPEYPATVVEHDLAPGGLVTYFMTGPQGDRHHGWWRIRGAGAPNDLEFEDGFADDSGTPNPDLPVSDVRVRLADQAGGGTVMTIETTFPSLEAMEQMVAMGMEEGITAAIGQIDAILAAD